MLNRPYQRFLFLFGLSLALVIPVQLTAQQGVDSLLLARDQAVHDTLRIRTDLRLGRSFENSNFDSALFYYNRALDLASTKKMTQYPFFKGLVLESLGFASIYGEGQVAKGISYMKRAFDNHISNDLLEEATKTEYNIGFFYGSRALYDSAIFHYKRVIDRNSQLSSMTRLHESYNNAGLLYFYKGQYANSALNLTKAIELKEKSGETREVEHSYMNLGTTYTNLGEHERAKRYYQKAISINLSKGKRAAAMTGYRNIAESLIDQDSLEKAMSYLEEAFEVAKDEESQIDISMYYNGVGKVYESKDDFRSAEQNYQKAYDHFTSRVNDRYSSSVMTSLGRVKLKLLENNPSLDAAAKREVIQEVLELGNESWIRASRSDIINRKLTAAELLKAGYQAAGDYKRSLQYADTAFALTNAINGREQSQAIAFATTEYETERVENENALLQETQNAQSARLRQQNLIIYGSLVMLILLFVIVAIIYRGRLRLKKAKAVIEESLSEKELLLKEIHHRVKNNLQVVSSLLDLQSRGIEDEAALSTFMEGQNRVKAMALIHQKLYQNEDLATIDFAEYAENLMKELSTIYPSAKVVETKVETKGNTQYDIDTAIPLGLILNELISNAYKYAFDDGTSGQLSVSVEALGDGKHQLTVSDSGAGLPAGFDFSKAKSLGLRLVRRLAKQLYGTVDYQAGQGAKFVVIFTDTLSRKAI